MPSTPKTKNSLNKKLTIALFLISIPKYCLTNEIIEKIDCSGLASIKTEEGTKKILLDNMELEIKTTIENIKLLSKSNIYTTTYFPHNENNSTARIQNFSTESELVFVQKHVFSKSKDALISTLKIDRKSGQITQVNKVNNVISLSINGRCNLPSFITKHEKQPTD